MLLSDRPAEEIVEEGMSDDEELDEEGHVVADEQPDRRSAHRPTAAAAGKPARSGKAVKQQEKGVVYISRIPPHLASIRPSPLSLSLKLSVICSALACVLPTEPLQDVLQHIK